MHILYVLGMLRVYAQKAEMQFEIMGVQGV